MQALMGGLRELRRAADRIAAADIVHQLRNGVLTAQGALYIVEARLAQGHTDDIEKLLDLADNRLRECRALVARTQRSRFLRRQPAALAA